MGNMKMHYSSPAAGWQQGLPIGNGRLGAVVQGGMERETWSLTEVTYWSGHPEEPNSPNGGKAALEEMRKKFFDGDYEAGERLARETLEPPKGNFGTHLTLADLDIKFLGGGGEGFRRELDLEQAIVSHAYRRNGYAYKREAFATHAGDVLVSRMTSEEPGGLSFELALNGRTSSFSAAADEAGVIAFGSQATEDIHSDGTCGVFAGGIVRVAAMGGTITGAGNGLRIDGADEAVIYIAVSTDYGKTGNAWENESAAAVERAVTEGYDALRAKHVADYRELFARVRLDLGDNGRSTLPTDERLRLLRSGEGDDPALFALFYQYGRYLTIAGSRENSPLPMNLQGIWNDGEANRMAWSCDYHLDVNTEMNYYPTEAANLAECHVPLTKFVAKLAEAGRSSARAFYGSEGWVAHVFTNAWGFSSPGWGLSWGMNVTGGLWIAMQLKEHYEYGRDRAFLEETAYPVLKEASLFFLDYMVVHPEHGWLVTGPSNSPENSFYPNGRKDGADYALSMGPTMDMMLVRELFVFCVEASKTLGADEELRARLETALTQLPPLRVGANGQLQEWLEDFGEAQPDHRHLSHLYGLYPGNQITPQGTPELSEAARTTLGRRMGREGLEDVEFTLAQFAASFARLGDGANAHKQLTYLIGQLCFDNLFTYSKPGIAGAETNIFVADGNFGGTSAIGEMLLQSHADAIELLPALPENWSSGTAEGLRARRNAIVDIRWSEGRLTEALIRPRESGKLVVRLGGLTAALDAEAGRAYKLDGELRATVL
ncbi:glycoside hydrolase family 95 protein [Paenibacillus sp. LHD-117]|uniref:glycoside hydrolase family 95 protein n=1 Tax=Paenibacillus sp. LHD-117 TaxID=3071412 RepID=UPI0027DF4B50|nr:glycoside hydrolase family 95 protein [Paenibacillus sp. LHD-117]MDQ6421469.1 glycoside hydrolase family 95 protein [Paenibacillus sp. LHD-117]